MRLVHSKWIIVMMLITWIGSTAAGAVGAAGVVALQGEQPSSGNHEALTRVSVLAGNGDYDDWDGAALKASFRMPQGMAVLKDGSVLVADSENHLIRQINNGQVSTYAGFILDANTDANGIPSGGWNDGAKQAAVFNTPSGMDTDSEGNVYLADTANHQIRKISKDGMVSTIAGDGILGHTDGAGTKARFYHPQDVAVAADGTLYVADTLNHLIRRIATDGQVTTLNAPSERVVEVIAGQAVPAGDYADGELSASKFNEPTSIAIDKKGNLYVSDTGNHVIRYIDFAEGTVTTAAGLSQGELPKYVKGALYAEGGYADGSSSEARFYSPRGIAVTEEQGLIIADSLNHTIRYLVDGQVSTIAGVPAQFGHVDGINGHNLLHRPTDVAVLPNGSVLIADSYNNKIRELAFYELPSNLPQNDQVKVVFEDQIISFDAQPETVKGRTMIPVRALSESMGYKVEFDDNNRTIELSKGDVKIRMQVGSRMISNENAAGDAQEQQEMEIAPYIKDGRYYVPVRFFSETFGADVEWEQNTRTVILREIVEAVDKLPAADHNSRAATLEGIKGTVWINQAGGSLSYRAYDGTILRQGDQIITEVNSSAILKTVDRKDEIAISENTDLYISNLSQASQEKHTSFYLWSGQVGASVTSLINAKDTFKMLTPTAVNDVRGTHLLVSVDPYTGVSRLFVGSGLVQAGGNGTGQSPGFVYPGQQLSFIPESGNNQPSSPYPIDIAVLVNQASPAVIQAMLKNMQQIHQENEQMLKNMNLGASGSIPSNLPTGMSPDEFEQYQENLRNLMVNITKQARDQQKIDEDRLQEIIDEANKHSNHKIDLNNVPPLQLTEQQKQQQELQKRLEEERKKQQEEQNKLREQQQKQADLLRILAEKARLEQENKKQLEEAAKRAAELLKQQLSDAERQRFEQQQQELERQKQLQLAAQQPQLPTPSSPISTPTPTPAPTPTPQKVATPVTNKESGSVEWNTTIELSTSTSGALIYFTTDGSIPSSANGMVYTQPIDLQQDTTIKAIAVKSGYTNSDVMTVSYTVVAPEPESLVFAAGYPKTVTGDVYGSKLIQIHVQTKLSGEIFYVVVPDHAPTPTYDQIEYDFNGNNSFVIDYYHADIPADRLFVYDSVLTDDNTEYDVYVLVKVYGTEGITREMRKLDAITP